MKSVGIAAILAMAVSSTAFGVSSVNLNFSGSQGGVGNTGFDGVYNLNPAGYSVGGGTLMLDTLGGDTFGQYGGPTDTGGADPDTAQNFFYSNIDPAASTEVDAKVVYNNLTSDFAGGGIWTGTDTDHYIRLGVYLNDTNVPSHTPDINIEVLRENQDLWGNNEQDNENPSNTPGVNAAEHGPGRDIESSQTTIGTTTADGTGPLTIYLRLIRTGNDATAYYSLDGTTYIPLASEPGDPAGPNSFDAVSIDASNLGVPGYPGSSVELPATYKVGAYAINGPGTVAGDGVDMFQSFSAVSVPEPASIGLAMLAAPMLFRRRKM
jgi:hypothetical protein